MMRDDERILNRRLAMIGLCQQSREDRSHGFLGNMIDVQNLGPKSKQTDTSKLDCGTSRFTSTPHRGRTRLCYSR